MPYSCASQFGRSKVISSLKNSVQTAVYIYASKSKTHCGGEMGRLYGRTRLLASSDHLPASCFDNQLLRGTSGDQMESSRLASSVEGLASESTESMSSPVHRRVDPSA
jgi:hypothetical protein